jgi:hypothetical protein
MPRSEGSNRAQRVTQHQQIADGVLLLAEDRTGDDAGGVVDGTHQGHARSTTLEPVVAAAIDLQQSRLRHAVATAAMARAPTSSRAVQAGIGPQAAQGLAADEDLLVLGLAARPGGSRSPA